MVAEASPSPSLESPGPGTECSSRVKVAREAARVDAALVERFNAGDSAAFDEIIARHRLRIYAVSLAILHNHADAEEIAQDTLIRAHRHLANFRGDCSLSTWLHSIGTNLSRNRYWYHFRRRRQDMQSLDCAISDDSSATFAELAASDAPSPVDQVNAREFSAFVVEGIMRLAPIHRDILERRILQDHSYDEIAEVTGVNVGTVKSRISRAREQLRVILAETCPDWGDAFTRETLQAAAGR